MLPAAFEPAVPASERPQTHALNRAATGTVYAELLQSINYLIYVTETPLCSTKIPELLMFSSHLDTSQNIAVFQLALRKWLQT